MVPTEGGPENFILQSSWHRSKILAVSRKHWKGRRGGSREGVPPPLLLRCTAVLIHPLGGGGFRDKDRTVTLHRPRRAPLRPEGGLASAFKFRFRLQQAPPPPLVMPLMAMVGLRLRKGHLWGANIGGGRFRPHCRPRAYAASHGHYTAKGPGFRRGKISPPSVKTNLSHAIIPPLVPHATSGRHVPTRNDRRHSVAHTNAQPHATTQTQTRHTQNKGTKRSSECDLPVTTQARNNTKTRDQGPVWAGGSTADCAE